MKTIFLAIVLTLFSSVQAIPSLLPSFLQRLTLPGPNGNLQFAISRNNQAAAVWTNFPNQVEIQGVFFNGTGWINLPPPPTLIGFSAPTIALGSSPKVGIDQFGNVTVVYVSPNGQIVGLLYQYDSKAKPIQMKFISSTVISTPVTIGFNAITNVNPSNTSPILFVQDSGNAVVVWIQATPYQVLASRFLINTKNIVLSSWSQPNLFMPIPANLSANTPTPPFALNSFGIYPAAIGMGGSMQGVSVWIDGPTGEVRAGSFSLSNFTP